MGEEAAEEGGGGGGGVMLHRQGPRGGLSRAPLVSAHVSENIGLPLLGVGSLRGNTGATRPAKASESTPVS